MIKSMLGLKLNHVVKGEARATAQVMLECKSYTVKQN